MVAFAAVGEMAAAAAGEVAAPLPAPSPAAHGGGTRTASDSGRGEIGGGASESVAAVNGAAASARAEGGGALLRAMARATGGASIDGAGRRPPPSALVTCTAEATAETSNRARWGGEGETVAASQQWPTTRLLCLSPAVAHRRARRKGVSGVGRRRDCNPEDAAVLPSLALARTAYLISSADRLALTLSVCGPTGHTTRKKERFEAT